MPLQIGVEWADTEEPMGRIVAAALIAVVMLIAVACRVDFSVSTLPTAPSALLDVNAIETIVIGRSVTGTIFLRDPGCTLPDGRFGPCRRFRVPVSLTGLLRISVTWDDGRSRFALALVNLTDCCVSPLFRTCDVRAGSAYEAVVILLDPDGHRGSRDAPHHFHLLATVE